MNYKSYLNQSFILIHICNWNRVFILWIIILLNDDLKMRCFSNWNRMSYKMDNYPSEEDL